MGVLGSTFTIPKFDVVIHYNVNEHQLDLDGSEEPSRARDQFKSLVYTRRVLVLQTYHACLPSPNARYSGDVLVYWYFAPSELVTWSRFSQYLHG